MHAARFFPVFAVQRCRRTVRVYRARARTRQSARGVAFRILAQAASRASRASRALQIARAVPSRPAHGGVGVVAGAGGPGGVTGAGGAGACGSATVNGTGSEVP
jgi:hypothetical protein